MDVAPAGDGEDGWTVFWQDKDVLRLRDEHLVSLERLV